MEQLKTLLCKNEVRGVARSCKGEVRLFQRKGIIDLYELVTNEPGFLLDGMLADRVIGRGAALLAIKAGVSEVYAELISQPALEAFKQKNIKVAYSTLTPNIINRLGTGTCPVEQLTTNVDSPDEAYELIGKFLQEQKKKQKIK